MDESRASEIGQLSTNKMAKLCKFCLLVPLFIPEAIGGEHIVPFFPDTLLRIWGIRLSAFRGAQLKTYQANRI